MGSAPARPLPGASARVSRLLRRDGCGRASCTSPSGRRRVAPRCWPRGTWPLHPTHAQPRVARCPFGRSCRRTAGTRPSSNRRRAKREAGGGACEAPLDRARPRAVEGGTGRERSGGSRVRAPWAPKNAYYIVSFTQYPGVVYPIPPGGLPDKKSRSASKLHFQRTDSKARQRPLRGVDDRGRARWDRSGTVGGKKKRTRPAIPRVPGSNSGGRRGAHVQGANCGPAQERAIVGRLHESMPILSLKSATSTTL